MKKFFSFVKIEHTLFTLPLIYSGVALGAAEMPSFRLMMLILLAAVGARTAAFALNRIIDRNIDAKNPRTVIRELPSGRMTLTQAVAVLIAGCLVYFGSAYFISLFCFYLSPIPLIVFMVYPFMKRFTPLAHFGVGVGMAMAPLGGYFAVAPSFDDILSPTLLCLFTVFWGAGFDIIYATLDEDFDNKEGLFSFVSRFGKTKALLYSSIFHFVAFSCLIILFFSRIKTWYAAPFLVLTGLLLYIEQRRASDVDLSFFRINAGLGFVVFTMILLK